MRLAAGTRISACEITTALGTGGMGEVYRAHDPRLKRDVALKVLPAPVTGDRDCVARFQREAELLAALNHPNIAHIHSVEEQAPGSLVLVMELVDGEDLATRIARGPLVEDDALSIARQIAEALEGGARARHHPPRFQARDHQGARGSMLDLGTPRPLFQARFGQTPLAVRARYSVSKDGRLLIREGTSDLSINVILNWAQQMTSATR